MSDKRGSIVKSSEFDKSEELKELRSEVDKLKTNLKTERSKNADADRKRHVYILSCIESLN